MSSVVTPARFNNLRAYNLLAALAITYSTWAFHLRSSLIITPKSLYDPTRSTSWFYMASNYANSLLVFTLRPQIQFKLNNIIYPTEDLLWWSIRAAKNYFIFYTRTNFQILNFSLEGGEKNGKCFHFFRHCEAEENVCIYATMFCFVFAFVFLKKRSLLNDKWWEAKKKKMLPERELQWCCDSPCIFLGSSQIVPRAPQEELLYPSPGYVDSVYL